MEDRELFYKTDKWEVVRTAALIRDEFKCQYCLKDHKRRNATCVHHIFPLENYPQYAAYTWNLISLCDKHHNEMHDRFRTGLSKKGLNLLRATAATQGIDIGLKPETILVIGLRGTGKTTYVSKLIDTNALAYDLDAIANAFMLQTHGDTSKGARHMANDFLLGFVNKAHDYAKKVYIIRTAPKITELEQIRPDKVIICKREYVHKEMDDRQGAQSRIDAIEDYCKKNYIAVECVGSTPAHL